MEVVGRLRVLRHGVGMEIVGKWRYRPYQGCGVEMNFMLRYDPATYWIIRGEYSYPGPHEMDIMDFSERSGWIPVVVWK